MKVLWIAFNLYFYRVLWQLRLISLFLTSSCELLSICIFIGFSDSGRMVVDADDAVVNCFQFVFLSGSLTAQNKMQRLIDLLWIAFNLYFYRVLWQLFSFLILCLLCCELLSICIFIGFSDSAPRPPMNTRCVVNCFQFVFLSGSLTAKTAPSVTWTRCELLSICIFIGFSDSIFGSGFTIFPVVNCFQFVFLSGSLTALRELPKRKRKLWIAFNLYFYRVLWQPLEMEMES